MGGATGYYVNTNRGGCKQAEKDILAKAEDLISEAIKKYDEGGDRFWLGARYAAIEIRDMINEDR